MNGEDVYSNTKPRTVVIQMNSAKDVSISNAARLLERAQQMDVQALAQLHDMYYPAVYRYVRYRLDDEQVTEDICSDVFLRLLNHFHRQKGEIHDLRAWLLGTAANLVNDYFRHKYRRPTEALENHEGLASRDDPRQTAEHNDHRRAVQKAIQQLTNEQQHVLSLRFGQELSIEETAQMMNKTVGAIKVLQFRALAAIRRLLEIGERGR